MVRPRPSPLVLAFVLVAAVAAARESPGKHRAVTKSRTNATIAEPLTAPPPEGVTGAVNAREQELERRAATTNVTKRRSGPSPQAAHGKRQPTPTPR